MRRAHLLFTAALVLCTACSGGPDSDSGKSAEEAVDHGAAVRSAIARTSADSARVDEKIELRSADSPTTYVFAIAGAFDLGGDRGRLTVELQDSGMDPVEEVFVDDTVYVRGSRTVDEGEWASAVRSEALTRYFLRAPLNDPEHLLRQTKAMRQVTNEGEEQVNGAPAVHYRGTIDHATATLRMTAETKQGLDAMREKLGDDVPVFADVWVDGKGRAVQARLSYYGGMKATTTMTLSDFGTPVKAEAPPAEQVVPVTAGEDVLLA
ncbi:LppX_LprAFG lipoprotein [Streptomyces sp. NBC_01451]|uniref:LppX_LprAFG lipoprotein n=1 Tax=Streptomyces sp. NBC_01451 TaxID=2903872 RepID=UPI002E357DEC|nr:LppX_LprAFG lipoprotein [Streptomyces sp. NBC_01451]